MKQLLLVVFAALFTIMPNAVAQTSRTTRSRNAGTSSRNSNYGASSNGSTITIDLMGALRKASQNKDSKESRNSSKNSGEHSYNKRMREKSSLFDESLDNRTKKEERSQKDNYDTASSQQNPKQTKAADDISLVVDGEGQDKTEATKNALRSAIEQAYGVFVSAQTDILNDELIKDEIVTIASGNIKSYKELSSTTLPNGNTSVSLSVIVSIGKLISYAQSKGASTEFAGQTFMMNMKMRELNKKNEEMALNHFLDILNHSNGLFDYNLTVGTPQEKSNYFSFPLTLEVRTSKNYPLIIKQMLNTLSSLSLSQEEIKEYESTGSKYYTVRIFKEWGDNNPDPRHYRSTYYPVFKEYYLRSKYPIYSSIMKGIVKNLHAFTIDVSLLNKEPVHFKMPFDGYGRLDSSVWKQHRMSKDEIPPCFLDSYIDDPEAILAFEFNYENKKIVESPSWLFWWNSVFNLRTCHDYFNSDKVQRIPDIGRSILEEGLLFSFSFLIDIPYEEVMNVIGFSIKPTRLADTSQEQSGQKARMDNPSMTPAGTPSPTSHQVEDHLQSNTQDSVSGKKAEYSVTILSDPDVDALPIKEMEPIGFNNADSAPRFNGGDLNEFKKWVNSILEYPEKEKEEGVMGRVYVLFTISSEGVVQDVKVKRSVSPSLDAEAIRVISLSPQWIPATKDGYRIPVTVSFPVTFQLR